MSPEDRNKNMRGVIFPPTENFPRSKRDVQSNSNYSTGPASIDWLEKGLVGPVENQGKVWFTVFELFLKICFQPPASCMSCLAFSVSQVVDALARKNNITTPTSPQQLLDCNTDNSTCRGGWPPHALDYAAANGMTDLKQYPYIM